MSSATNSTTPVIPKKDYWLLAAQALDKEDEGGNKKYSTALDGLLAAATQGRPSVIDEAIAATNRNRNELIAKQWKVSLNGKEIVLRDQLGSILEVLQTVKDFGSALASLDPVHAGLPWAGVCLLMQITLNDSSQYSSMVSDAEEIALIISRYKQVEAIYFDDKVSNLKPAFEEQLLRLYKLILKYEIALAIYYRRNTVVRFLRSIPQLDDKSDLMSSIRKADSQCQTFQQIFDSEDASLRNQNIMDMFSNHKKLLEKLLLELNNQDNLNAKISRWISPTSFEERHNRNRNKLKDGGYLDSGKWLLQDPAFQSWDSDNSTSPFLWIHGSVGTGKSSVVCLAIENRFKNRQPGEKVAYFYCSGTEDKRSLPTDIFLSLLRQLCWSKDETTISSAIKNLYNESLKQNPGSKYCDLAVIDSVNLIKEVIAGDNKTTMILDALDECSDFSIVIKNLEAICQSKPGSVNVLLSSRESGRIAGQMAKVHAHGLSTAKNSTDISAYVDNEFLVRGHLLLDGEEIDLSNQLKDMLKSRAQGMFRWVELQLSLFLDQDSGLNDREDAVQQLEQLSEITGIPHLDVVYQQIFNKNTKQRSHSREVAIRVYRWLYVFLLIGQEHKFGAPKLKTRDIVQAVSFEGPGHQNPQIDEQYILHVCSNLVIVDLNTNQFAFAHFSVLEFLLQQPFWTHNWALAEVTKSMLFYLVSSNLEGLRSQLQDYHEKDELMGPNYEGSFSVVAFSYWPLLISDGTTGSESNDPIILQLLHQFLIENNQISQAFALWIKIFDEFETTFAGLYSIFFGRFERVRMHAENGPTHPLFLAAVVGIKDIIVMLHSCELLDLDMRNFHGETALETACAFNNYYAADILLQYGAKIYPTQTREGHIEEPLPGPLGLAASTGNAKLVSRLLTASATSTVPQTEYPLSSSALHIAAFKGFKDVAALLLQGGLDIEAKCALSGFYVHYGLLLPVFTRLLRSIDCAQSQGPISSSCVDERVSIVEELQSIFENKEGSDLPYLVPSSVGYTPLFEAVLGCRMEMVEFLLDQRADINATSTVRDTPLIAAIECESLRMVRALIKRGADAEFRSQCKGTCLMVAAGTGYEKMILLFLEQLTKAENMTSWGQELGATLVATVIGQIASKDEQKMYIRDEQADSMMDNNADNIPKRTEGDDLEERARIIRLLLSNGANIEAKANLIGLSGLGLRDWKQELHYFLYPNPSPETIQAMPGFRPLFAAVLRNRPLLARILLDQGADPNAKDEGTGATALYDSAHLGLEEMTKLLLERGADVNLQGGKFETPLGAAKEGGHLEIVELLVKAGARQP